jgi:hypothetical protein
VDKPANPFEIVYTLLRSHARLFYYEFQHEKEIAWRRLRIVGAGVMCLVACGAFIEIAVFGGLQVAGLNLFLSALVMAAINALLGSALIWSVGKRPAEDGEAFEMSRAEYQRTKQWIDNRIAKNGEPSAANSN